MGINGKQLNWLWFIRIVWFWSYRYKIEGFLKCEINWLFKEIEYDDQLKIYNLIRAALFCRQEAAGIYQKQNIGKTRWINPHLWRQDNECRSLSVLVQDLNSTSACTFWLASTDADWPALFFQHAVFVLILLQIKALQYFPDFAMSIHNSSFLRIYYPTMIFKLQITVTEVSSWWCHMKSNLDSLE